MFDKENYDTHKGLALWVGIGKAYRVIEFNQKTWLKP